MALTASRLATRIGIPVALVTAGLWTVRKYLGESVFATSLSITLVFLGALLIVWLVVWIVRRTFMALSARRARRAAARAAEAPAGSAAGGDPEVAALQANLDTALRMIRESKLARGRRADEALYALPWILMLGSPGAGKTAALRECGIDFPFSTAETRRSRRGAPPAGCDYWFSRRGIVLDLDGRIGADEDGDRIFASFLSQLRRARRERPIDGVVLTVSLGEVIDRSEDDVERLAGRLRERCDLMTKMLGFRFPVYVLFTHADQIEGFAEFFGSLRSRDRAQAWGATVSKAQRQQSPVEEILGREFDRLAERLEAHRLRAVASERDPARIARILSFPSRFGQLRRGLDAFIGTLFQSTPYSERPVFRGFYFSGVTPRAAQERPAAGESAWGRGEAAERELMAPEVKSYFLEDVLERVVFADRPSVQATVDTRLRHRLWMDVVYVGVMLASAVLVGALVNSFVLNRDLVESTRLAAQPVRDPGWNPKSHESLAQLQQLGNKVAELDQYESATPLKLRWGLYSGREVVGDARLLYFRRIRDAFIVPSAEHLRRQLSAFSAAPPESVNDQEFYGALKAYLMMVQPEHAEAAFLETTLSPLWKRLAPPEDAAAVAAQLKLYAGQLQKIGSEGRTADSVLQLAVDRDVISRSRRTLCQRPLLDRIYLSLKLEAEQKFQRMTLAAATGGAGGSLLESAHEVPGVFTRAGWNSYMSTQIGSRSREALKDDWVLGSECRGGSGGAAEADYERRIRDRYFAEYAAQWRQFLEGITVRPMQNLAEARTALSLLSQRDSAISRLLASVVSNTELLKEPDKTDIVTSTLEALRIAGRPDRNKLVEQLAGEFGPLRDVITSPDEGKTPSLAEQFLFSLGKMHDHLEALFGAAAQWEQVKAYIDGVANNLGANEFQEATLLLAQIDKRCATRGTSPVKPLLEQVVRQTWAAVVREAGYTLDGVWKTQIADPYKRDIEPRFPFNPSSQTEVPLEVLTAFLRPRDGTLDAFYEKELKLFLEPSSAGYVPKSLRGFQIGFSAAFLDFLRRSNDIRLALFGAGGSELRVGFELTPEGSPNVSESRLEIDGQTLTYRNELARPTRLEWPGRSGAPGAQLRLSLSTAERPGLGPIDGQWAWFRLLSLGSIPAQCAISCDIGWTMEVSGRSVGVRYRLRTNTQRSPFVRGFFRGVECPEKVTGR